MLAKEGSPERTLACRILAHMIMSKAINETLGTGLAREAGNCFKASLDKSEASQAAGEAIAEELRSPTQLTESLPESASEPSNAMPSPAQFALARAMPKRIYIQYANKEQTTSLDGLRTICRDKGWIVPQAENVGSRAPNKLQVRYFNDDDAEVAQKVFDLLTQTPPFNSMPRDEKPSKLSLKAPPGQVEIWLPRS